MSDWEYRTMRERPVESDGFDYSVVDEAVERIVDAVSPHLIIIFGSVARKTARKGSDIDMLVVMDSDKPWDQRYEVDLALMPLPVPKDIIVVTPEEFDEWKDDEYNFIYEIVRTGYVVYGNGEKMGLSSNLRTLQRVPIPL